MGMSVGWLGGRVGVVFLVQSFIYTAGAEFIFRILFSCNWDGITQVVMNLTFAFESRWVLAKDGVMIWQITYNLIRGNIIGILFDLSNGSWELIFLITFSIIYKDTIYLLTAKKPPDMH